MAEVDARGCLSSQNVQMTSQNSEICQQPHRRRYFGKYPLKNKLWSFIRRNRYYFGILGVYFLGFLLITPLGKFNPGVPPPNWYSLSTIDPWDDTSYYMVAKSLIIDGDLDYSNEKLLPQAYFSLTSNGNPVQGAKVPIGSSILWAPFILVAHMLTKLFNFIWNMNLPENGYGSIYLAITCIGSSLYTFLSLLLSFKILTKFFSPKVSLLSVLTVFIGNSLFYNTYIRMLMSHSPEVFTIALFTLFFLNAIESGKTSDYLLFGLSSGLMVIVRYDNAMFFIMPLFHIFSSIWTNVRSKQWDFLSGMLRNYSLAVLVSFVVVLPQFLHFYIQAGSFLPNSLGGELSKTFVCNISVKELFFGQTRNVLWGKPIVAIGAIGSLFFIKQNRLMGAGFFAVICCGILWLFWRPHAYWWGMDFGIRHLIKLSLPLAIGYAALIASVKFKGKKALFIGVSLAIVLWEYLKIIQIPKITPVLQESFLTKAALKIPDLLTKSMSSVLTGTDCSYLSVLRTYGLGLEKFNVNDWLYLVVLPLSVLCLCIVLLWIFVLIQEKGSNRATIPKIAVTVLLLVFGSLCFLGLSYPEKSPEKMYNDFRDGGILAFTAGRYVLSAKTFRQALFIRSEGDYVVKGFQFVLDKKIKFPFVFHHSEFENVLSSASESSNTVVRSASKKLLEEISIVKQGYYDFGTVPVRKFLKKGWSGNEGPYPNIGFPTLVWAIGRESEIDIYVETLTKKTLVFKARPYPADQFVNVLVNGKNVGYIKAQAGWREYGLSIDSKQLNPGKNCITFKFKYATSPAETDGRDTRKLAMAFDWLKLEDATATER